MIRANKITGSAPEVTLIEANATGAGATLADDYSHVMVTGTFVNSTAFTPSAADITVNGTSVGTLDDVKTGGSSTWQTITFSHILENLSSGDVIALTAGAAIAGTAAIYGVK